MKNREVPVVYKKRLVIAFSIFAFFLVLLCLRTGYIQLVKGEDYRKIAIKQQTKDELVEAKRGKIVDRNGTELALSTIKYAVWVRPGSLKVDGIDSKKQREETISYVSKTLGEIAAVDGGEITTKLKGKITLVKVAKYLENEKAEKIRKWIADKKVEGISITRETKRYYPSGEMASHLLGSVTDDNNGLSGLESRYNGYLKGISGRWIQNKDVNGKSLVFGEQKYHEPKDGDTLVLTIDSVIQNYAENSVKKIQEEQKAKKVSCIVMDTKTGEVLAMASTPGFNPNDSRRPTDPKELAAFQKLSGEDQMKYLNKMWRNPVVSDVYIPGSTAKLMTVSMALEENLVSVNDKFNCTGSVNIYGTVLKCWRHANPHGVTNLIKATSNSCNPAFIQLAGKIGINKFYDYFALFGLTETTGIDYPGEANSIIQNIGTAGPVGLATMGFGQGLAVTPLQQITAVSAIGNQGQLMEPHLVKEIRSADGKLVKKIEPKKVRQAVSAETAKQVCDIMEFTVKDGGAGEAAIAGYRVGGKTGTSNVEAEENRIVASYVGMAPMDDPKLTVLFIVEEPQKIIYGSGAATPGGTEVLRNALKYLKVTAKAGEGGKTDAKIVTVPDVIGKKFLEAKSIIEGQGLKYKVSPKPPTEEDFIVKDQYPKGGTTLEKGGVVYIYRK